MIELQICPHVRQCYELAVETMTTQSQIITRT